MVISASSRVFTVNMTAGMTEQRMIGRYGAVLLTGLPALLGNVPDHIGVSGAGDAGDTLSP